MHRVLIGIAAKGEECRVFSAGIKQTFFQSHLNLIFQPGSSVLGAPDQVVLELVGAKI
jgi:hypothetical protein